MELEVEPGRGISLFANEMMPLSVAIAQLEKQAKAYYPKNVRLPQRLQIAEL